MSITPESVQQLLNSADYGDRLKGINQLRQLEPKLAWEMIQPLLADNNARIRYAAVSQLDPLGKQDLDKALELLRDRLFHDTEYDVKAAAADAIGGLKLTAAFEDLQTLYHQSSEWLLQMSIIAALGELGEPRAFDLLKEALNSDNGLLKTMAIGSLGELGNPSAVPLLVPFATDEDWQIRYRLVRALARLGGPEATSTLAQLAQDPVEQVAQEAKNSLCKS
jgi:HEAT repeat protein